MKRRKQSPEKARRPHRDVPVERKRAAALAWLDSIGDATLRGNHPHEGVVYTWRVEALDVKEAILSGCALIGMQAWAQLPGSGSALVAANPVRLITGASRWEQMS